MGTGGPADSDRTTAARRRMVEHDLVPRGIDDEAVLAAMGTVPRHAFVDPAQRSSAYDDRPLPIGEGQTISQPYIVALTAQTARLGPDDRVLEVGTGSGYAAAVFGAIAAEVWTIERHAVLADRARRHLAEIGADNVHVVTGDGSRGLPEHAPFDAIAVAAASPTVPSTLVDQLADGGRLVVPVGPVGGAQRLVLVERDGNQVRETTVLDVRFVPLVPDDHDPAGPADPADGPDGRPDA